MTELSTKHGPRLTLKYSLLLLERIIYIMD